MKKYGLSSLVVSWLRPCGTMEANMAYLCAVARARKQYTYLSFHFGRPVGCHVEGAQQYLLRYVMLKLPYER